MKIAVRDFRSNVSEILKRAQEEDVAVSNHGKPYAVVISQARYEALLNQSRTGLDLFADLARFDLTEDELDHPPVRPKPLDL